MPKNTSWEEMSCQTEGIRKRNSAAPDLLNGIESRAMRGVDGVGMRSRALAVLLLGVFPLSMLPAQTPSRTNPGPIQAELLAFLQVRHLEPGTSVFARVTADWNGAGCVLRRGSILEARVETAIPRAKGAVESAVALSFVKAQCGSSEMSPVQLVLAAVAAAPDDRAGLIGSQFPFSAGGIRGSMGSTTGGGPGQGNLSYAQLEFMALTHSFPTRPNLKPGDVYGIKGLKLAVGAGPKRSSVLKQRDRDVALDKYTQFLLVPASIAFLPALAPIEDPTAAALTGSSGLTSSSVSSVPVREDVDLCRPPLCSIDLPTSESEFSGAAFESIAIKKLGYSARPRKEIESLDEDESIAWIGPQELLVAFNPHTLVRRDSAANGGAPVRVARAVLFDTTNRRVTRTVDWELSDAKQYLWPLAANRVLVHVGSELRVYGKGLEIESRISLDGPLAFVRMAPNGELMAIATMRERHSADLHAKLRDSMGRDPEEDVDILILNRELNTIAKASATSDLMAPTLLNEGQVKLLAQPKMRYRLTLVTWESETNTLTRFSSGCTPMLSSFAPDLLFLVTCNMTSHAPEYRVLRSDGKLVLQGQSNPQDFGQEALGNTEKQTFAVKVIRADRVLAPGTPFHGTDLETEELRVYRAVDGKRLFAIRINEPQPSHGGYALSPDGSQLAVLANARISFYPVPAN